MKIMERVASRLVGGCLMFALLVSSCAVALPAPQEADPAGAPEKQQTNSAGPASPAVGPESLPDSPGAAQYPSIAQNDTQSQPVPPPPQNPPAEKQKPVGTAAAETSTTTGFAVSRPAGAALAPAKQRRSRTILISVAAVVGAAVAVGMVAALSKGTPSKPPGAQ